jgi:polysaccharide transporter, PST family
MGGGGAAMGILVFLLAPFLVQIILGQGFALAVPVLRILSLLVPLIALSNVFGMQWMLPLGLDGPFNTIILLAGLINLGLAVALATAWGDLGMAWAVVIAEAFVTGSMYLILRFRKLDPLRYRA